MFDIVIIKINIFAFRFSTIKIKHCILGCRRLFERNHRALYILLLLLTFRYQQWDKRAKVLVNLLLENQIKKKPSNYRRNHNFEYEHVFGSRVFFYIFVSVPAQRFCCWPLVAGWVLRHWRGSFSDWPIGGTHCLSLAHWLIGHLLAGRLRSDFSFCLGCNFWRVGL